MKDKPLRWKIEFSEDARKDMKKLGHVVRKRVYDYMKNHVAPLDDPRIVGKPLLHELSGKWRFRVAEDYRVLCEIEDNKLLILVVEVKHRSKIYTTH